MNNKICFVIAPIGEVGSSTRVRSDQILSHVIREVAQPLGFNVVRADEIAEPGIISTQILEHILNDPLVIADLTERNPNVYYELAVRHAVRKPVIQLVQKGEPLPFDVAQTRTIVVDHKDLDIVADAKKQLAQYIENIQSSKSRVIDSPISLALDLQAMRESSDPQQASLADIAERMTGVHGSILSIQSAIDKRLTYRLDRLLKLSTDIRHNTEVRDAADAASKLEDSVEGLRNRLVAAIDAILDEVQNQHVALARKIQDVFDEQSNTATKSVESSFSAELEQSMPRDFDRDHLLKRLLTVFMHGMTSMGKFQHINVKERTEASTQEIRDKITKSIHDVFQDIDKIEEQVLSLPSPQL